MSCSMEFVQYVCEQLQGCGDITYRRMFGEFGFYVDGVYIGAACDNQLFIKVTDAGKKMIKDPVYGEMYPGAKPSGKTSPCDKECFSEKEKSLRIIQLFSDFFYMIASSSNPTSHSIFFCTSALRSSFTFSSR